MILITLYLIGFVCVVWFALKKAGGARYLLAIIGFAAIWPIVFCYVLGSYLWDTFLGNGDY